MRTGLGLLALAGMCALSAGGGAMLGGGWSVPSEPESVQVRDAIPREPAPWREALDVARATAAAGSLRAEVLEVLNVSDSSTALAEAVELLGWVGGPEDTELLVVFAVSRDPVLAPAALEALGRLGTPEAEALLLQQASSPDPSERHPALAALGSTGSPQAFGMLQRALATPEDAAVAARALARFGTPEAAHTLAAAFAATTDYTAFELASALAAFPEDVGEARRTLHRALGFGPTSQRDAALEALAAVDDPDLYPVLERLVAMGTTLGRSAAVRALGQLSDPRALPLLAEIATSGESSVRYDALQALGQSPFKEARDILLDLVESGPPALATEAVYVLDPSHGEVLGVYLWALENRPTSVADAICTQIYAHAWLQPPPEVLALARKDLAAGGGSQWRTTSAIDFLLRHGDDRDRSDIYDLLQDGPVSVRTQAIWSLDRDPSWQAERLLVALLEDPHPSVRSAAQQVLLNRPSAHPALEAHLLEQLQLDLPRSYDGVEDALVQLGSEPGISLLLDRVRDGTEQQGRRALSALSAAPPGTQAQLVDLLDDLEGPRRKELLSQLLWSEVDTERVAMLALDEEDPALQAQGASALARVGGRRAVRQLERLLDHDDLGVRSASLSALAQVGGPGVEDALVRALDDPELGSVALSGLQQLGTPTARTEIGRMARSHPSSEIRSQALWAVAYQGTPDAEDIVVDSLYDDDETVRASAVGALESLGSRSATEQLASLLDGDDDLATQAALALQRMGGRIAREHQDRIEALAGAPADTGDFDFADDSWLDLDEELW